MNYKIKLFLITSLFALAKCQDTLRMVIKGHDSVDCYYCGIEDNCELPFDKDNGKIIKCEKACIKFDGYAKDGKRIVVRNCGYFTGDECLDGIYYEDEDTIGTTCHCHQDKCNSAPVLYNIYSFIFIITPMSVFLM
jgi:hypothetical protein